jgi:ABC-2 type transport system permease protein
MTAIGALVGVTLRGLLGRRRLVLMILLAALPVLVGLLIRLAGGSRDTPEILDAIVIRAVLPLIALIVGTATIGSEIEDGTIVFILVKPVARWRTAFAKVVVAAGRTLVLVIPPIILTGVLVGGAGSDALAASFGFALAAMAGGAAYAAGFTALGAVTSRALIIGLVYVLLWEGVLAGLLEGTRFLSVRQATLGLAAAWTGTDVGVSALDPFASTLVIGVVLVGAFAIASIALARFQIRSAD